MKMKKKVLKVVSSLILINLLSIYLIVISNLADYILSWFFKKFYMYV